MVHQQQDLAEVFLPALRGLLMCYACPLCSLGAQLRDLSRVIKQTKTIQCVGKSVCSLFNLLLCSTLFRLLYCCLPFCDCFSLYMTVNCVNGLNSD